MNCQLGYVVFLLYILGQNFDRSSARHLGRRRKAIPPGKSHFHKNNWGLHSTHPPVPEFVGGIPGVIVIAGKDAVLRCEVKNLGDYKVTWSVVNLQDQISIGTNVFKGKSRLSVTTINDTSWFLHIKNVTQDDTGYYACQINTNPITTQAGFLHVVEPPEFVMNMTDRNVTVRENTNVTMSCKATGNPIPEIKWRREDGQPFLINNTLVTEYKGVELEIIGVKRDHMAAYLCVASNEVPPAISRRIYLNVEFPPLIWIQNQLVGAPEGIDVDLECHTEAHPISDNYWLRNNEAVVPKSSRYIPHLSRNSYKVVMKLTIRNLREEDYGHYKCVAKNTISETEGSIKLYKPVQLPKPVTEEPPTLPTRKVITVPVTTEYRVTEIIRRENDNAPGRQQKYGHGIVTEDDEELSSGVQNHHLSSFTNMFIILPLLWITIQRNYR